jgi:hypothetical protein
MRQDKAEGMIMIAENLMEDLEVVLVAEVRVVVPAVVVLVAAVVHQMDEAEATQMAGHLHTVHEMDAVVLQTVAAVLQVGAAVLPPQEEAAVLQAMEDVAAKKVVLLQADEICIETIKGK